MGFHVCEYCQGQTPLGRFKPPEGMRFGPFSSVDVTLRFKSGRAWVFPHVGLLHYVTEHDFLPPRDFIDDVMHGQLDEGSSAFAQTKSLPTQVGYLQGPGFPTGKVPDGFVEKLDAMIEQVRLSGRTGFEQCLSFRQTRGQPK